MDAWVPRPDAVTADNGDEDDGPPVSPILKLMEPAALPTELVAER